MKPVIYYRVSTDKQDIASQKHEVELFLKKQNVDPSKVTVFTDNGISGKTLNRPEFQKMIKLCIDGKFDTIIVYKLDRFSRSANTAIRLLLDLDDHGVGFMSATQPALNLGHENPFRRTMLAIFSDLAEIEREVIVERVKAGMDAAKKKGMKFGRPLKLTNNMTTKILNLRKEGLSIRDIAKRVTVSKTTVGKALKMKSA